MQTLILVLRRVLLGIFNKLWTRNRLPQGGVDEKSDSSPRKSTG